MPRFPLRLSVYPRPFPKRNGLQQNKLRPKFISGNLLQYRTDGLHHLFLCARIDSFNLLIVEQSLAIRQYSEMRKQ